jgi:anthranilate synthase component 1
MPRRAPELQANMSKDDFKKMVATCKEYIHAGDAFRSCPPALRFLLFNAAAFALSGAAPHQSSPFLIFLTTAISIVA